MSARDLLHRYLDQCPLIAIVRGMTPDVAEAIGDAIFEGGIRIIEVPLNSPNPLQSIEKLARRFGERMLVGAGTAICERLLDFPFYKQSAAQCLPYENLGKYKSESGT